MLINSFGDRLLRDIVPNCIYLRGTGKIVSVVIFFFTNKVVARTSHACRINARSNKGYLFSSCFESIEIRFRLPAHGSGRCCFLASDYGYGKRKDTYCDPAQQGSRAELQASRSLNQPSKHSRQLPAATPRVRDSQAAAPGATAGLKPTCG